MSVSNQVAYINLSNGLNQWIEREENIMILTLPGLGISHMLQEFCKTTDVSYVVTKKQRMKRFVILDLNFASNPKVLEIADQYMKQASKNHSFALVVDKPSLLKDKEFISSYVAGHIYTTTVFLVRDKNDTFDFARDINPKMSQTLLNDIYATSGGIGRLVKYFSLHPEKMKLPLSVLVLDKELERLMKSTVQAISECDPGMLNTFGITKNGNFVSTYLKAYFEKHSEFRVVSISVFSDLTFKEHGVLSKETLTTTEKSILEFVLENDVITREQISEIKWGKGSYDDYSDQAINKTIQRLNAKLTKHRLLRLPRLGYKLSSI